MNFVSLLKKNDSKKQLVYYQVRISLRLQSLPHTFNMPLSRLQAGIGTYTIPQIAKPMMAKVHKALDAMIGVHLNAHVMSEQGGLYHLGLKPDPQFLGGYEFLMQNCKHQKPGTAQGSPLWHLQTSTAIRFSFLVCFPSFNSS